MPGSITSLTAGHAAAAPQATRVGARDDPEFVSALRRSDPAACQQLIEAHHARVFRLVYRLLGNSADAEEVTQDTFLHALAHVASFRGHSSVTTWLLRIAHNQASSCLRRRKLRRTTSLDSAADTDVALGGRLSAAATPPPSDTRSAIQAALLQLDPDSRAVLVLRDVEDLDYERIAEVLSWPLGTVKSRLFRARERLGELLRQLGVCQDGE